MKRWSGILLLITGTAASASLLYRTAWMAGTSAGGPPPTARQGLARREMPLREVCRSVGVRYPPPAPRVEVRKAPRTLSLYSGKTLLKEYPVALGLSPEGDKEREGDRRTPEGEFYLCTRLEKSRFHRFMGISYPAPDDARRGLHAGQITRAQARAIESAWRKRQQPPWDTSLGGAVGLHGGGAAADWTWGCIALDNPDLDELMAVVRLGTPVRISP